MQASGIFYSGFFIQAANEGQGPGSVLDCYNFEPSFFVKLYTTIFFPATFPSTFFKMLLKMSDNHTVKPVLSGRPQDSCYCPLTRGVRRFILQKIW